MKPLLWTIIVSVAALTFGWQPNPIFSDLSDNTCLSVGDYSADCPSRTGYSDCMHITDYSGMVYDADRHNILMFGGGHASTSRTDVDAFYFDSLKWKSDNPSTACNEMVPSNIDPLGHWASTGHPYSIHTYDHLVYCPNVQRMMLLNNYKGTNATSTNACIQAYMPTGMIAAGDTTHAHYYDTQTKEWHASKNQSINLWWIGDYGAGEYDPVSGRVIYQSERQGLWTYNPVTDSLVQHNSSQKQELGLAGNLVYYPPNDKFYYFANLYVDSFKVFEITLNRNNWNSSTITRLIDMQGTLPPIACAGGADGCETGFAYDSVNQIIGGGINEGAFYAFNPMTRIWTRTVMNVQPAVSGLKQLYHTIAYNPVDNVFVFLANDGHTYAYRYKVASSSSTERTQSKEMLRCSVSPNPINKSARAIYSLKKQSSVSLKVLDVSGRLVRTLWTGEQTVGSHEALWDGKNGAGVEVSSGRYLFVFAINGQYETRSIVK